VSAAPSDAAETVELGGGFLHVRRPDGSAATFVPHLQSAGVAGLVSPASVNARDIAELRGWLAAWGFGAARPLAQVEQVHGKDVVELPLAREAAQADGLVAAGGDAILSVKAADCAPVWFADMASDRFALVHAGWRGVGAGVIAAATDALVSFGTKPEDLAVAIGPHLRPCCFEVGPEVAQGFARDAGAVLAPTSLTCARKREDGVALDLAAAIRSRLHDVGVREEQIFTATACTRCHAALFHSYRRNGAGGPLMAAIAARRP
jgi:purine-nucleoside/S-methyl-5'-thioadenosine phosphorylase / adenosine deaminase